MLKPESDLEQAKRIFFERMNAHEQDYFTLEGLHTQEEVHEKLNKMMKTLQEEKSKEKNLMNNDFQDILNTLDLQKNQKELIQNNIELFKIIFDIGFNEGIISRDNSIFTSGLGRFHDLVCDLTEQSLSDEELKVLFYKLPDELQREARHHGLDDTCVADNIYEYLEHNGLPK